MLHIYHCSPLTSWQRQFYHIVCFWDALQDSKGVFAAREFVWWYNGHPDHQQLPVDLSKVEAVAVCGIGNVALDCARVLLRPVEQLAATDIAQHALQQLKHSKVKVVQLCARRGPVQVRRGKKGCFLSACLCTHVQSLHSICGLHVMCWFHRHCLLQAVCNLHAGQ